MLPIGSAKLIPDQQENTYPESSILYEAILSAKTGHLYFPLLEKPYLSQPYGPLFYWINLKVAESGNLDMTTTMVRARTFVFASFLACGLMAFLICKRLRFSVFTSALAGCLVLGFPTFKYWSASARPDVPCLLAMLLCVYFSAEQSLDKILPWVLGGIFAAIACLLKQTGIAVFFAILPPILWKRRYRESALFFVGFAVPIVIAAAVLFRRHEPFFEQSASVAHGALWSLSSGVSWIWEEVFKSSVVLPLAIGAVGTRLAAQGGQKNLILLTFGAMTWAVFLTTVWQRGASDNYLLPGLCACALLLPSAIQLASRRMGTEFLLIAVSAAFLWGTWGLVQQEKRLFLGHLKPQPNRYSALRPYRILSDNPYFTLQGRDPEMLDPFLFHSLELAGYWNSAPIAAELRNGEIDLVILNCSWRTIVCSYRGVAFFGADILHEINSNYTVLCSTMQSWVLVPRSRRIDAQPELFAPILNADCGTGTRGRTLELQTAPGIR